MKKLTKKVKKEIQETVEQNQPEMDWNGANFDQNDLEDIFKKGWDEWIGELMEHVSVDMNEKNLLSNLPDVVMLAKAYSNYDCANSFDEMEPETYLHEVYQRVKAGVKEKDYLWEFQNGAYGGSLFCFVFKTDIKDALEMMEQIKVGKTITIPKNTQFGFFSSFSGAGSVFEKRTIAEMVIPITGETEYDSIGLVPDVSQSYSMRDVYGSNSFVDDGTVVIN